MDADTGDVIETRYKPWGEVRYTTPSETLPTRYTFTGQYSHINDEATDLGTAGFGLLFYNARWYDPMAGRFAQADSIVPGGVQGLDRYAYVNNSPVQYTDPSGHRCAPEDECDTPHGDKKPLSLLDFSNEEGARSFTDEEKHTLEAGARAVAGALAREMRSQCSRFEERMGECHWMNPTQVFYGVFGGPIKVKRVSYSCKDGCWAEYIHDQRGTFIAIYSGTTTQIILNNPNLIVHEIGHVFYWAAGGFISGSSVGERKGFYGLYYSWQFGKGDDEFSKQKEIFADMFLGWVYGKWEEGNTPTGLSVDGNQKKEYMDKYMPIMFVNALW